MSDSRQFVPELTATLEHLDGGRTQLLAPSPGLWRDPPQPGTLVRPGAEIGTLEILGVLHRLRVPAGALGLVVSEIPTAARASVDYGSPLLILDAEAIGGAMAAELETDAAAPHVDGELVFLAPTSGRFYRRPAPDKPNFVELGQVLERGQTIGLLEVMKTFTRLNYDDPRLPERAKVVAILVEDQDELEANSTILRLEAET